MRFDRIALKGLGPFRAPIEINFAAAGGPLVAVTGDNGAGKTTLLELLAGALHRECPTRGTLSELATARDAFVEVSATNGTSYTIRQTVDHISGKGESLVLDGEGQPLVASGKRRAYDEWADAHLPPKEVLFSSVFQPQGSHGFLDLKAAERKSVLLRILGIARLERLAELARERQRKAKGELDTLLARMADERVRSQTIEEAEKLLSDERDKRALAEKELTDARAELAKEREKVETANRLAAERARIGAALSDVEARIGSTKTLVDDVVKRIANNRGVLREADAIRKAVARAKEIEQEQAGITAKVDGKGAEARALEASAEEANQAAKAAAARVKDAAAAVARANATLSSKEAIETAKIEAGEWRQAIEGFEGRLTLAREGLERLRALDREGIEGRVQHLRAGLKEVGAAKSVKVARERAEASLASDDDRRNALSQAPDGIQQRLAEIAHIEQELREARSTLAGAERLAARGGEIAAAEAAHAQAVEAHAAAGADAKRQAEIAASRWKDAAKLGKDVAELEDYARSLTLERNSLETLVKKATPLEQAEARIAELEPQHARATGELAELEVQRKKLAAEHDAIGLSPVTNMPGAERRVETSEREVHAAHAAIAVRDAALEAARASAKRLDQFQQEREAIEQHLADWAMLAEDLGRDGLQALEIDCAGPELSELTNDLLHTCFGSRWTVTLEASRLSADGKKVLEGCEVRVLDTQAGREGAIESFSGGERVILGEAVSLALTMLACRRSGLQGVTLVRDETGAALDPEKARAYIAMLRRAAELVGASKILFVSHDRAVQDMADARIVVSDGKALVA